MDLQSTNIIIISIGWIIVITLVAFHLINNNRRYKKLVNKEAGIVVSAKAIISAYDKADPDDDIKTNYLIYLYNYEGRNLISKIYNNEGKYKLNDQVQLRYDPTEYCTLSFNTNENEKNISILKDLSIDIEKSLFPSKKTTFHCKAAIIEHIKPTGAD